MSWKEIDRVGPCTAAQSDNVFRRIDEWNRQSGRIRYKGRRRRQGEDDYVVEVWEFS